MTVVIVLLALSALIGFALGTSFSWHPIAASSAGTAVLSSAILQIQGFGALPGIAVVVACLTINQMAYLAGVFRRADYFRSKPTRYQAVVATTTLPANHTSNKRPHPRSPERAPPRAQL
jgi:hypothetical protein